MKSATGLAIVAVGAILAFAVTTSPSFFNFQVAGWVLMVTGIVGLLIPRRGYGWLRRRLVLRGADRLPSGAPAGTAAGHRRFSRWLMPGGMAADGAELPAGTAVQQETIDEYIEE
jgi:hypothetical protein